MSTVSLVGDNIEEGKSEPQAEGPNFHHTSTCSLEQKIGSNWSELDLPKYSNGKLGYVVMSPGEGQARKLIVYAPVFQAEIGASQVVPDESGEGTYLVTDDEGLEFRIGVGGVEQSR